MNIEFIDLKKRYKEEKRDLIKIFDKVLKNGSLILSKEVDDFEKNICKFTNGKYCLGLNSGTDGLMMALWSLGIKKGDEVITTPLSFVASIGAIIHVGAVPVFVDVTENLNINEELIESAITEKTRAIMPVHWTGKMCNMDVIINIAKKNNLFIIEDAAQAMGSYYKGQHAGTFGDISAFSAHPLKNLNAIGDGGFVVTNNKNLYDKIKLLRTHGIKKRDYVEIFGVNSRLDSLNAEILSYRLTKLKKIINKRRKNISLYKKYLKTKKVKLPSDDSNTVDSYVMMVSQCEKRNQLKEYLFKKKIPSLIYYGTPLHLHKASKILNYKKNSFPLAEKIANSVLSFPHHQYLSEDDIKYICKNIDEFYEKN